MDRANLCCMVVVALGLAGSLGLGWVVGVFKRRG